MISLTQFRKYCLLLFRVMTDARMVLDVVYKGKVYEMTVVETDKKPLLKRQKKVKQATLREIEVEPCDYCTSLLFNGICMSRDCPANQKQVASK